MTGLKPEIYWGCDKFIWPSDKDLVFTNILIKVQIRHHKAALGADSFKNLSKDWTTLIYKLCSQWYNITLVRARVPLINSKECLSKLILNGGRKSTKKHNSIGELWKIDHDPNNSHFLLNFKITWLDLMFREIKLNFSIDAIWEQPIQKNSRMTYQACQCIQPIQCTYVFFLKFRTIFKLNISHFTLAQNQFLNDIPRSN